MKLPSFLVNQKALSNFDEAIQKEWIITNGLGGYASSTVLGINTRKYHGLLVAAMQPPLDRRVCLAKLDEEVTVGNDTFPLYANEFQNGIFPRGYAYLKEFSASPFLKCVYALDNVEIEKTIFVPYGKNVVAEVFKLLNRSKVEIEMKVFPLVSCRGFHSVTDRWKTTPELVQKQRDSDVTVSLKNPKSTLRMKALNAKYFSRGKWIDRMFYREEAKRGESFLDDCYQTGYFEVRVKPNSNESFAVVAAAGREEDVAEKLVEQMPLSLYDLDALYEREVERRTSFLAKFYGTHVGLVAKDWLSWAVQATDMFVARAEASSDQLSVIAGYHWFGVWGRDTFVSLPGLMFVTGRFDDARKVFLSAARDCQKGLVPNYVPETGGLLAYNSVDASLWFANAVFQYLKYTGDFKFVREQLWETLKSIFDNYVKGTLFGIKMNEHGLLSHGAQLTWMDVVVDGQPLTPRAGMAVEVEALWFNFLKVMQLLNSKFDEASESERCRQLAEKAKSSFNEVFWNTSRNCLFDAVNGNDRDASMRPNQVIAAALDFCVLDSVRAEKIVDTVQRELLVPYGLRTLAKEDSRYIGVYAGDRRNRDRAYHNGTVWPWLLGSFATAYLKAKGYADFRREYVLKNFLMPLFTEQFLKAGFGVISEVFDGDPPHNSRGCIAQAWSVAEPLRAYLEDAVQLRPQYEHQTSGLA